MLSQASSRLHQLIFIDGRPILRYFEIRLAPGTIEMPDLTDLARAAHEWLYPNRSARYREVNVLPRFLAFPSSILDLLGMLEQPFLIFFWNVHLYTSSI